MSVTTTGKTVPRVPKAENLRLKALIAEAGMSADLGLHLQLSWTKTVTTSTALWRADVQRRRFIVSAVFTSAAVPVSALGHRRPSAAAAAPAPPTARRSGRWGNAGHGQRTRRHTAANRLGRRWPRWMLPQGCAEAGLPAGTEDGRPGAAFRPGAQAVEHDGDAFGAVCVAACRMGIHGEDGAAIA